MNVSLGFSAIQYCLHIHVRCLFYFSGPGVSLGNVQNLIREGTSPECIKKYYRKNMDALKDMRSAVEEANVPEKFKYAFNIIIIAYAAVFPQCLFISWNPSY